MRISAVVELISRPRALARAEPAGPPVLDESLDLLPGLGVGHLRRRALEAAVDRLADQVRLRDPVLLRPLLEQALLARLDVDLLAGHLGHGPPPPAATTLQTSRERPRRARGT